MYSLSEPLQHPLSSSVKTKITLFSSLSYHISTKNPILFPFCYLCINLKIQLDLHLFLFLALALYLKYANRLYKPHHPDLYCLHHRLFAVCLIVRLPSEYCPIILLIGYFSPRELVVIPFSKALSSSPCIFGLLVTTLVSSLSGSPSANFLTEYCFYSSYFIGLLCSYGTSDHHTVACSLLDSLTLDICVNPYPFLVYPSVLYKTHQQTYILLLLCTLKNFGS